MELMPRPHQRASRRLRHIVIGIAAVAFSLLLLSLFVFLRHRAFLRSSSYEFVENYIANASEDTFFRKAEDYLAEHLTPYEKEDAVKEKLAALLHPKNITFARAEGYTDKRPVYTLYAEGEVAFTLRLKNRFSLTGQPRWQIASITVAEDNRLGNTFYLEVPHKALVTVGGIELDLASATPVPYYALTEFEQSMSGDIFCDRYDLGQFFLTPDLTVLYDGIRLQASTVEGDVLRYGYPSSATSMATITVPYGAAVTLNSLPISNNYRVETGAAYPYLTRFEKNLSGLTTVTVYQISGLFAEPQITVRYNGTVLTAEEGTYTYRLPEELMKTVVIAAPSYATVKLNGVLLTEDEITAKKCELPIMAGVTGYAKDRPYLTEYTVSGLLLDPTVTAFDKNGNALTVSTYYSTAECTVINCTSGSTLPDREQLTLRTFAELLATYLYSGANKQSRNFDNVIAMTPGDSPAYRALKDTYASLYEADKHTDITFGEVSYLAYYPYSSTSYSAIAKLPFTSTLDGKTYSHELTVDILYIYSGSIRRIVNYRVLHTASHPTA